MYSISKHIENIFSAYTMPSFGTIKPALDRLEKEECLKTRRTMSDGGKRSCFYAITQNGLTRLKELLLEDISKNPVQFFSNAQIKLACASFLSKDEISKMLNDLKTCALSHKFSAENTLSNDCISLSFYQRVTLDNSIVLYQNFINLLEELEQENARNS